MGYTTEFEGRFHINKPLYIEMVEYINKFSSMRHMKRDNEKIKKNYTDWEDYCYRCNLGTDGEYFLTETNILEIILKDGEGTDILDFNIPPETQPWLWCQWIIPEDDTAAIEWDGRENFYSYEEWLIYLIDNFLAPNNYIVNGNVKFKGEVADDIGTIHVENNHVFLTFDAD